MKLNIKSSILILTILAAAFSRLIPHAPNFTPIGAVALFGAAYFSRKYLAFLVPAVSIFISSLVINNVMFHPESFVWFDYNFISQILGFALISLMGMYTLKQVKFRNVLFSSISASLIFFVVSNFGDWMSGMMYPQTLEGLALCYRNAIPFFWNTLAGDLVYCGILFGGFELVRRNVPALAHA